MTPGSDTEGQSLTWVGQEKRLNSHTCVNAMRRDGAVWVCVCVCGSSSLEHMQSRLEDMGPQAVCAAAIVALRLGGAVQRRQGLKRIDGDQYVADKGVDLAVSIPGSGTALDQWEHQWDATNGNVCPPNGQHAAAWRWCANVHTCVCACMSSTTQAAWVGVLPILQRPRNAILRAKLGVLRQIIRLCVRAFRAPPAISVGSGSAATAAERRDSGRCCR